MTKIYSSSSPSVKEAADLTVYYCERVQHNSYNTLHTAMVTALTQVIRSEREGAQQTELEHQQ